jgi:hypothetical protein
MAAPRNWTTLRNPGRKLLDTANANRDGSGTLVDLVTGIAAPGTMVTSLNIAALGVTSRGFVRLFVYDGTNNGFYDEIIVPEITTAMLALNQKVFRFLYLCAIPLVGTSQILRASTHTGDDFHVIPGGYDYA